MELRQLKDFAAIVEEGTVTAAAKRLHMTQPPLTAQLRALEEELGCSLFRRDGRRLRLTDAGQLFYQRAEAILGLCRTAEADLADFGLGTAGTLRVGVVSSVRTEEFFGWLAGFSRRYPSVHFDLSGDNTYRLIESIRSGQLDAAVVRRPFSAQDIQILPIRKEKMLAVGRADFFPGIRGRSVSLAALSGSPLILYRRWESVLRSRFEAAGLPLSVFCRNDDAQTTLALAKCGLGVGILPASAISQAENGLKKYEISDGSLVSEIAAVYRDSAAMPECARLFLGYLKETAAADRIF